MPRRFPTSLSQSTCVRRNKEAVSISPRPLDECYLPITRDEASGGGGGGMKNGFAVPIPGARTRCEESECGRTLRTPLRDRKWRESACLQPVRKSCYLSQSNFSDLLANLGFNFLSALGQSAGIKKKHIRPRSTALPVRGSRIRVPRGDVCNICPHIMSKMIAIGTHALT